MVVVYYPYGNKIYLVENPKDDYRRWYFKNTSRLINVVDYNVLLKFGRLVKLGVL